MFTSFKSLIKAWPTVSALAADVRRPYLTVVMWKNRNSIPPRWWNAVVDAAERRGIDGVTLTSLATLAELRATQMHEAAE